MKSCIVLTGGAGFIGCEIARKLPRTGLPIIAIDNLHPQIHPSRTRPAALPDDVELLVADVCDAGFWAEFLKDHHPRTIFHLAAETGTGQSLTEATRHANVNVVGTTAMTDALLANDRVPDHIILSSSRAVYGEGAWRTTGGKVFYPGRRSNAQLSRAEWSFSLAGDPAEPLAHTAGITHPAPSSVYGATKLAQEHILGAWCAATKSDLSVLRFQNVYGPGQSPFNAYTGIITLFHRQAHAGKTIEVYEDGHIGRDFVFISDVVDSCVAAAGNRPAAGYRLLDVGTGVATTIFEAARMIAAYHGAPEPVVCGKFRDGDVRWAVADTAALRELTGSSAYVDFQTGSAAVAEWLRANGYL